jgi:hypothetical protein
MSSLECINCGSNLELLSKDHKEYTLANLTYDGTRKWFLCSGCKGVFCRDKVTGRWGISPDTYARFLEEGVIEDILS